MRGINRISFSQFPIQEVKLNLFADYYSYYVHFCGMIGYMELDNPLGIVRKLIFQLNHNKDPKCVPNVLNYFNKLKSYGMAYWRGFPAYKPVRKVSLTLQNMKKPYPFIMDNLSEILGSLTLLDQELTDNMLRKSAEQVKNMILCDHEAQEHLENIIFHTRIIASEIIMLRHSKQEALGLLDEIITTDYKKFPFPPNITTEEDKRRFFNEKSIHHTLDAIIHFCETPQLNWNVNFKISGLVLPEDYIFCFDQTKVFPAGHAGNSQIIATAMSDEDPVIAAYFTGDDFSIAEVQASSVTYSGAYNRALKQLSYATGHMEAILQREIAVDKKNYFFSINKCDYGYYFGRYNNETYHLTEFDKQKLDDNAYRLFDTVSLAAEKHFIEFEPVYIRARKNNHIDELWHYLEVLHNDDIHSKSLKSDVSGALVLYEKKFRVSQIHEYLRSGIHVMNADFKDIGLTQEEQIQVSRKEVDFSRFSKKITSIFFQHVYKEMNTRHTKVWKASVRRIYYSLMEEAYEYRNLIVHAGKSNDRSDTKLTHTFPLMVVIYRWIVFDYMKKFPAKTLKQVLAQIRSDVTHELGTLKL